MRSGYCLTYLNTYADIEGIVEGLRRRPRGTYCFYGTAGTGKTELAHHLADQIGKPFHVRRASNLLSKYIGEAIHDHPAPHVVRRGSNHIKRLYGSELRRHSWPPAQIKVAGSDSFFYPTTLTATVELAHF